MCKLLWTLALAAAVGGISGQAIGAEDERTVQLLKELLRMDTTNAPGDTRPVARRLEALFTAAGIENQTVLAPNGQAAHFIARLEGDGSKRPVLVAAHTDVVPVERERWSVDPFAAVEKDGFIYGRGALDNKSAVAAFAQAVIRLKQEHVSLARDIIFLAEADEEQGQFNTSWLAREHWPLIDAEFALNEGGSTQWDATGTVRSVAVSYADKLTVNLRLTATGASGHSSRPLPVSSTANGQLIAALARLSAHETPIQLTQPVREYLHALGKQKGKPFSDAVERLLSEREPAQLAARARDLVGVEDGGWGIEGLLRNTLAITMMSSGVKPNVIPGTAQAVLNARLLPGNTVDDFVREVEAVIGNPRIRVEIISGRAEPDVASYYRARSKIPPSPLDTDLYGAIQGAAKQVWPKAVVMPMLLVASTDATPWRERGIPVYGIGPFPVDSEASRRVHGDDERVAVAAVQQGSQFVYHILRSVAARNP